jgi:hypothetical protein
MNGLGTFEPWVRRFLNSVFSKHPEEVWHRRGGPFICLDKSYKKPIHAINYYCPMETYGDNKTISQILSSDIPKARYPVFNVYNNI